MSELASETPEGTTAGTTAEAVVRGAAGMPEPPAAVSSSDPSIEDLEEAMRDVVDPELGINVVDLGLVYDIQQADGVATIDMTLTSAACPLTDVIEEQARAALTGNGAGGLVDDIKINWVWMPPWAPRRSRRRVASSCAPSASGSDTPEPYTSEPYTSEPGYSAPGSRTSRGRGGSRRG